MNMKIRILTLKEYDSLISNEEINEITVNTWVNNYQKIRNRRKGIIKFRSRTVDFYGIK